MITRLAVGGADRPSITIGSDGLGLISRSHAGLEVLHCQDLACSTASASVVDPSFPESITLSGSCVAADEKGLFAYFLNLSLKVAHCVDLACSAVTTATIENSQFIAEVSAPSITLGRDGSALVAYTSLGADAIHVAHCSDPACSSATVSTLDAAVHFNRFAGPSVTLAADGFGLISYFKPGQGLMVAHCTNSACSSATTSLVDEHVIASPADRTSITLGVDGLGLIAYDLTAGADREHRIAHCNNAACSSATVSVLEPSGFGNLALSRGKDGLGFVVLGSLRVAHCSDAACSSANLVTTTHADSVTDINGVPDVTMGADGFALVAYTGRVPNLEGLHLLVAHFANSLGIPFFRPR